MTTIEHDESDLLPLSYLNDYLFCPRRAAMHLIEGVWFENQYTLEGSFSHRKVDIEANVKRGNQRNLTGMWLVSYRLGLIGKADLVEFVGQVANLSSTNAKHVGQVANLSSTEVEQVGQIANLSEAEMEMDAIGSELAKGQVGNLSEPKKEMDGKVAEVAKGQVGNLSYGTPYPVDFKRGKKRRWDNNEVQLCAQALCLEEMLDVAIPKGAIFHVKSQRREEIDFTADLRQKTEDTVQQLRNLLQSRTTPKAKFAPKCRGCSLLEWCLPKSLRPRATAERYIATIINEP